MYLRGILLCVFVGASLLGCGVDQGTIGLSIAGVNNHNKVVVCHVDANGVVSELTVGEPAAYAHIAHGDSVPGDGEDCSGPQCLGEDAPCSSPGDQGDCCADLKCNAPADSLTSAVPRCGPPPDDPPEPPPAACQPIGGGANSCGGDGQEPCCAGLACDPIFAFCCVPDANPCDPNVLGGRCCAGESCLWSSANGRFECMVQ